MRRNPSPATAVRGVLVALTALSLFLLVGSRNLPLAVGSQVVDGRRAGVTAAAILALGSLVIPPRVRSLGFSMGNLFIIPALIATPIVGGLADDWGLRPAILVLVPVLLLGALLVASVAPFVNATSNGWHERAWPWPRSAGPAKAAIRSCSSSATSTSYYGQTQVLFGVDFEVARRRDRGAARHQRRRQVDAC